ncbi:hypothetical protein [Criibacterium bergeronii]|uniref:DUF3221 domain-containing protein n=1 Tax=Criibacterium bergeronii TaxID=1871336 RepID=A0A1C0AG32_9FIRM|nr:hypothetical protein [Criibacterium bergeronii]RDY21432.1 hypothetical protein BBG48_004750 [Criibacterium bergeronii]
MKKILSMLLIIFLMGTLVACDDSESVSEQKVTENVIFENNTLKATYTGISEQGVMLVRLENKTENEITVLPMDSSVDGTMIQFSSGTLATIQGNKIFNQGWIIGSVPKENIEFKMSVLDEQMKEIFITDVIQIYME